MVSNCPFCSNEVKDTAFARQGNFVALYNIAPVVPGHSLIVPIDHTINILDLNDSEYVELMTFARTVARFLTQYYHTPDFDISIQQGRNAGQSIDHLHVHILPRKSNDIVDNGEWYDKIDEIERGKLDSDKKIDNDTLLKISENLRKAYSSK